MPLAWYRSYGLPYPYFGAPHAQPTHRGREVAMDDDGGASSGTELKKCKPQTPQGHSGLRLWGHQHWVYTSLGRSCAVASLLLPGLRGEENFRRGFRAPPLAHPLSARPHWRHGGHWRHTGSRASPAHPPTGSALRWRCGTRSNHVVSGLSYMPLAVWPVSNYGLPSSTCRGVLPHTTRVGN